MNLKNAVLYYEKRESARKQALMDFEVSPIWRPHKITHLIGFALFSAFRSQSTTEFRMKNVTLRLSLLGRRIISRNR